MVQIRQYRAQQRDAVAINLAQTFYNRDLARALTLMQNVPDGVRLEELRNGARAFSPSSTGPEYIVGSATTPRFQTAFGNASAAGSVWKKQKPLTLSELSSQKSRQRGTILAAWSIGYIGAAK